MLIIFRAILMSHHFYSHSVLKMSNKAQFISNGIGDLNTSCPLVLYEFVRTASHIFISLRFPYSLNCSLVLSSFPNVSRFI